MRINKNVWESTAESRAADLSLFLDVAYETGPEGQKITKYASLYPIPNSDQALWFEKNLDLLNKRIQSIHKQLTYWDLYKINTSVNTADTFDSTLSALAPGEACIINTNTFTNQGESYSRGDVIVKTIDNQFVKIPSVNSGFYFPAIIRRNKDNYTYVVEYRYQTSDPDQKTSDMVETEGDTQNVWGILQASTTMRANNLYGHISDTIYGIYSKMTSNTYTFKKCHDNQDENHDIWPVIKFYYDGEEIGTEFTITDGTITEQIIHGDTTEEVTYPAWVVTVTAASVLAPTDALFIQVK